MASFQRLFGTICQHGGGTDFQPLVEGPLCRGFPGQRGKQQDRYHLERQFGYIDPLPRYQVCLSLDAIFNQC